MSSTSPRQGSAIDMGDPKMVALNVHLFREVPPKCVYVCSLRVLTHNTTRYVVQKYTNPLHSSTPQVNISFGHGAEEVGPRHTTEAHAIMLSLESRASLLRTSQARPSNRGCPVATYRRKCSGLHRVGFHAARHGPGSEGRLEYAVVTSRVENHQAPPSFAALAICFLIRCRHQS